VNACVSFSSLKHNELAEMFRNMGPDMIINAFSVNIKGNQNVEFCNKLNKLVYRMLSHSNTNNNVKRVPLFLTESEVDPKVSSRAVKHMKGRLGVRRLGYFLYLNVGIYLSIVLIYIFNPLTVHYNIYHFCLSLSSILTLGLVAYELFSVGIYFSLNVLQK